LALEEVLKFSVCIPTVREHTLATAVRSIKGQTHRDWVLTVVGQGDNPRLRELTKAVAAGDPRIRYVHIDESGASVARNAAMALADGDAWAFTDDDCEADPDWLTTLARCFEAGPSVGLVGGSVIEAAKTRRGFSICPAVYPPDGVYDPVATGGNPPAGWDWIGANFAILAGVAKRAGNFDAFLGPGAVFPIAEDTDYKLRLEAMGVRMRAAPAAVITHTHGRRYGLAQRRKFAENYARGNGGLAGKLTLMGDPRGAQWASMTKAEWREAIKRPYLLPGKITRIRNFMNAYHRCLHEFHVVDGLLVRNTATARMPLSAETLRPAR
jgi:GT2 family glycosyltransferase